MKINLEINNITNSPVADDFFGRVAEETFKLCAKAKPSSEDLAFGDFLNDKNISISVALVPPEEIRKLNKEYRKHDDVTDILSFPEYNSLEEIKRVDNPEVFFGELILCYTDIKEYVEKENIELEKELANVFAHGILHLLGFDHGEEMFGIQKAVVERMKK